MCVQQGRTLTYTHNTAHISMSVQVSMRISVYLCAYAGDMKVSSGLYYMPSLSPGLELHFSCRATYEALSTTAPSIPCLGCILGNTGHHDLSLFQVRVILGVCLFAVYPLHQSIPQGEGLPLADPI